jgi:hypothetical protein
MIEKLHYECAGTLRMRGKEPHRSFLIPAEACNLLGFRQPNEGGAG